MELICHWLRQAGYPEKGVDWVSRQRAWFILVLGLLAWLPFIGLGWLLWWLLS
ncbi:MAG: hypothetical protein JWR39_2558 [Devosia sp.]|jgi:hypothetical protein|nr:hypothetical protein [Devosia sp.]